MLYICVSLIVLLSGILVMVYMYARRLESIISLKEVELEIAANSECHSKKEIANQRKLLRYCYATLCRDKKDLTFYEWRRRIIGQIKTLEKM